MSRRGLATFTAAILASTALSNLPGPIGAPAAAAEEEQEREVWQELVSRAKRRLEQSRARYQEALANYSKMRRQHARGDPKVTALEERAAAEAEYLEAKRAWEELPEQARRAGVPPGWLRLPDGSDPAAPSP